MKTTIHIEIDVETRKAEFGYWIQDGEDGEFIPINSEMDFQNAAEHLRCSRELLDMMVLLHASALDAVTVDLMDIWRRLDKIEQEA